ncbi:glycoside hydrolase family 16 protein [Snuella sedimenti]|uniref:Glycoside hydrolase family 16 protein n=1 Tax=Snuella sedimenti TaxID=2798802 RepID=A0A8J7IX45_9FLAO|nr:glycoside hydrolase family 16 protein [Snuella sedimenti]MBJ6368785.1 glycoside hydrolase family 16 protein [Snuella sedimenti]
MVKIVSFKALKYPALLFAVLLVNCKASRSAIVDEYIFVQKDTLQTTKWQVVWEDHFDKPQIDTTKWTKIPPNKADWGNYMSDNANCYSFLNGKLHLKGIVNPDTIADSRPFLTGGIYSKGKFAFQYGKIEIRAKLESAKGAWPAIWLLAEQKKYGKYPRNGEIDIMEHLNFDDMVYQTVHSYYTLELKQKEHPLYYKTAKVNSEEFNTYGLEWYPDKLVFTVNGKATHTYPKLEGVDPTQWPFDQPFYILIDQQLGGSWVGDVKPEDLPVHMIIDWVKIYQ